MAEKRIGVVNIVALVTVLILLLIDAGLNVASLLSPSWQVVDIRESRAQHHVGFPINAQVVAGNGDSVLKCSYKFNTKSSDLINDQIDTVNEELAITEMEHHHFFGWQKAVIVCMIVSLAATTLSLIVGVCAVVHRSIAITFVAIVFISLFSSAVGNGIFHFAAHRIESRFVQGLVGTYEQELGYAFYMSAGSTVLLIFIFLIACATISNLIRNSNERDDLGHAIRELTPLFNSRIRDTRV